MGNLPYQGRSEKRKTEIEYKSNLGPFVVPDCKTLKELMEEYIAVYGKDKWALSTYESNVTKDFAVA